MQTVAIAVFAGLGFSFYLFFIPFVGSSILKFHIYAAFSPLVSTLCIFWLEILLFLLHEGFNIIT
jgi:hypothetical protein